MMTGFYQGSLQDGIALALRETKAVVCFVRDDTQMSLTWEEEYFAGEEIAQTLDAKAVALRITAGSQEAGFLTSICPIVKFPTVIVIHNGTLKEYLVPDITKAIFQSRLLIAVNGQTPSEPSQQSQIRTAAGENSEVEASSPPGLSPVTNVTNVTPTQLPTYPTPQNARVASSPTPPKPYEDKITGEVNTNNAQPEKRVSPKRQAPEKEQKEPTARRVQTDKVPPKTKQTDTGKKATPSREEPKPQPPVPRAPPSQFRLQVRLFDGSSVRSSFSPTQTIRSDVRPWLDGKMGTEQRPYNLKHILTPLPSRTLSVSEESQSLKDLGLGSTATLVMVPVSSYTDAYSGAGSSLPVRGISAVYNVVSSAASTATGLVGSLIGYGPTAPAADRSGSSSPASASASSENTRARNTGLNIRTLRDQQNDRKDSQFYNGNQLNFQPRDQDRKND
ncbi:hypothetical protein N7520_002685 [Penicillium odoratum]|uniref:uncharacterized protein n=1 Tax=Penicillium odoratum TaxID=1167516 RepID=UPI00254875B4|nr:uncharacterized protein N7520_002685 [Penicillium odoratum]KAJ5772156.1 hypothetical protein N7520_002685 [Penicillium odoratum]